MLHWAQEHHCTWCCTSRADRQVSPVSQENWNAQTLRVRAANRAFSTSKPPRSCYSMYGCSTKEVWEGIWLRPVLSFCSEGQLCSVGEEFWGVLSAAWLMRCVWGCGGLTHQGLVTNDHGRKDKLQDSWKTAGRMPPTTPAPAYLSSSVLALEV